MSCRSISNITVNSSKKLKEMKHNLSGKRVLFFYLSTFNYENEIRWAMEREGAIVDAFNERPTNNVLARILIRLNRNLIGKYINKYYEEIIEKTKNIKYDFIFFIKGESISPSIVQKLRSAHSEAKIVMYYWDSIANNLNAKSVIGCFDKVLSFDKNDSETMNLKFLPLFYIPQYAQIAKMNVEQKYDMMFAGTTHSERYEFVSGIADQIKKQGGTCFTWFYFPSKINFYKLKIDNPRFRSARIENFNFKPMSRERLLEYYAESRIQLDMQHPKQTGLTMRTIETMGSKKKLITTNPHVCEYDFYRPENILIVDRFNPIIPKEFIDAPWVDIPEDIYNKYSISSWLNYIFE